MAHFEPSKLGWRARVNIKGVRDARNFPTMAEARNWATAREAEIRSGDYLKYPRNTLSNAIDRYLEEVSSKKEGALFEKRRLRALERDFPELAAKQFADISTEDMAKWRNARLAKVSPGTVQRELNLLSNLFRIAHREWEWRDESPLRNIKHPGQNASRDRRVRPCEVKAMCRQLGYVTGKVETKQQETALAFLIALRTAMRVGEILVLTDDRINFKTRVLTVPHKMQYQTRAERRVPFSSTAARLLSYVSGRGNLFTVTGASLDALFRKARDQLALIDPKIGDLHFHDSRAEALTRLARKVDAMTLAKISGHRDLKLLLNTYYRESAEDIAARLK